MTVYQTEVAAPSLLSTDCFESMARPRSCLLTAIVLLAGLGSGFLLLLFTGRRSADSQIDAIRKAGLPTNGEQLNNYYAVPRDIDDTTGAWTAVTAAVSSKSFEEKVEPLPVVGLGPDPVLPGEEWPQLEECRTALATTVSEELIIIRTAAAAGGHARFPVDFRAGLAATLTNTSQMRPVARILMLDAYVAAHDGDTDRVAADIRDMLAASEALGSEPTLISQLVRAAIYGMAVKTFQELLPHGEWSDELLVDLETRFLQSNPRRGFRRAFIAERAIGLQSLDSVPNRTGNKLLLLDLMKDVIDAYDESWPRVLEESEKTDAEIIELSGSLIAKVRYAGVLMLLPALKHATEAGIALEARRRTTAVAIEMYRHRLKHGSYPTSLEEIQFSSDASDKSVLTRDPFNGEPLKLVTQRDAVVIYSVQRNKIDDDGDTKVDNPIRGDEGFRLPMEADSVK